MARYLSIFRLFFNNSLQMDLEYRSNFVASLLMTLMDATWSVGGTLIFFRHSQTVGGWTLYEAVLVIGLFFLALSFLDTFVAPNVELLGEHIRKGTLDFVLIKPLNSQVHATLRRYKLQRLSNTAAGFIMVAYAMAQLRIAPNVGQLALFALLFAVAAVISYAFMMLLTSVAFWAVQIDNLHDLFFAFFDMAKYPVSAFPEPLRGLITFVIPIAFMSTVPAEVILGRASPAFIAYGVAFAAGLLFISTRVWRFALRNYTSASS